MLKSTKGKSYREKCNSTLKANRKKQRIKSDLSGGFVFC